MKFRHIFVGLGLLFPILTVKAQYVNDALRFSQTTLNGSARFQSMGGVNTALGADITSASNNPAGLGFYRKSEWSITPSLTFTNNDATMLGRGLSDGKTYFSVPNFGIVFSNAKPENSSGAWRGGSWGISYNQLNNYNNQISFQGNTNEANSLVSYLRLLTDNLNVSSDQLAVNSDQIGFNVGYNEMLAQLAYSGYLIDPYDGDGDDKQDYFQYWRWRSNLSANATENSDGTLTEDASSVRPNGTISTSGNNNQWSFSYGGNYNDKLYIGANIGIASIKYNSRIDYTEVVEQSTYNFIDNYTLSDNLKVSGTGFNATLGLIYRPNDIIRIGWSFTSPTIYNLNETSYTTLVSNFKRPNDYNLDQSSASQRSVDNEFDYRLTTPLRTSIGAAIFIGKHGFVSGDIEYQPYRATRLNGDFGTAASGISQSVEYNNEIRSIYRNLFNFRAGGEYRISIFRVRAGLMFQDDPFTQSTDDLKRTQMAYTGGLGIKVNKFFADFALAYRTSKQAYTPYTDAPSAIIKNQFTSAVITIGSSF
ncbi:hypothetical protein [Xanthocytophaga agilis]|uniref:Transporter n=1 Tax=Xanthocytophaga agilis TaxID=3048010 RepID=A0AAE3UFX6_9BACT|nr:hypothetical protein [Xanthocytophaga agilis]MDJ1501048.1 hypothetical protein [Xanthocytophaga agilis]